MTRVLFASAFFMLASAASASSPIIITGDNPPVARIGYDDVDLHSAKGKARVENRIRTAASRICVTGAADPAPLVPMSQPDTACYRTAVASGISQLNEIASQ